MKDPNNLLELGFDEESIELLTELVVLKNENNWKACLTQYFESIDE